MKQQKSKLGFTLIELMVVITIIGILATGAVSVYTSQIQKARDSNRVTSIKTLQTGVEQSYSDLSEYPGTTTSSLPASSTVAACSDWSLFDVQCLVTLGYMEELPWDAKKWSAGNGAPLDYTYNVTGNNWVINQKFEVSCGFEAAWSVASKANDEVDSGWDSNRMEVWNGLSIVTAVQWSDTSPTVAPQDSDADSESVVTSAIDSCVAVDTNINAADAWGTSLFWVNAIIIRWNCVADL